MSLILDALKRADAERQLGQAPGLHSQPIPRPVLSSEVSRRRGKSIASAATAVAFLIAAFVWYTVNGNGLTPAGKSVEPRSAAPAASNAPATPAASTTPIAPTGRATPATPTTSPASGPASSASAREAAVATELPVPPPLPAPAAEPPARSASRRASPPSTAVAADAAAGQGAQAEQRIPSLSELPPAVRAELPPLAVKGSMYSNDPANRMLLLDGRLLHEGDEVAPGLVLESLRPKNAVLRYKSYRFQIGF